MIVPHGQLSYEKSTKRKSKTKRGLSNEYNGAVKSTGIESSFAIATFC